MNQKGSGKKVSLYFQKDLHDKIKNAADALNVTFAAAVRDMCINDLPRFKARHQTRQRREKRETNTDTG